ncbi:hypothetical protein O181_123934 [Austropuccinia psidii MF-1]|uniref:Uncharacterized protein n=1 Tax=Austropuccinia psidii MF-1 TaxID=1389203 RepID=A0A9Q3KNF0_9BASI|nr:hypothetical protein [Austropuccinia psidii MF-1]
MVHNRNVRNYSVQPDECGQGRGKTKLRYGKYSSRKTFLEDARVAPHSLRSVPTNFKISSETELIQGLKNFQVEAIEIFQSQYQNRYREAKEEEWEICPSLWQGDMNSYLHIKSFLGQERTIELLEGWSTFSCKEKVKKIKNWLKNQSIFFIDQKNELEMTPSLEKEGPVVSSSSKPAQKCPKTSPKHLRGISKVQKSLK